MTLLIRFSAQLGADGAPSYTARLDSPLVGQASGAFELPFSATTQRAIQQALAPNFDPEKADKASRQALQSLGALEALPLTVGDNLGGARLAVPAILSGFDRALGLAESQRQPLPVELRFGQECATIAALPWELLRYRGRFLVADSSIALARYPEEFAPPTPTLADLPLRVLLILSEPLDAGPTLPHQARQELLHGLRRLDEQGAVIVDVLRPPTFQTLTEALTTGDYHLLVFYGHGVYHEGQGHLLFEDEFGGRSLVAASELGALVRNSSVRLVLLGACESAAVGDDSTATQTAPDIWSGVAPALVRAGVPLAIGMQVTMRVDAALAFLRQFALSIAVGKPVMEAVSDARKPLLEGRYHHAWFIPALYGRPSVDYRLFNPSQPLPAATANLRQRMQTERQAIERLEEVVGRLGTLDKPGEIGALRAAKRRYTEAHAELARRTPGGYAPVTSPLYGVSTNPVFVGRHRELIHAGQGLKREHPVVLWGAGGIGKSALAIELAHRQGWRYPGGVLWLDCRGGPAFDTVLDRMAAFCGIEAPDQIKPEEKTTTVRAVLANLAEPLLLIWDNAEDVWDNRDVRAFLRSRPANVQILLTTRENPEETAWTVVEVNPLAAQPMIALFLLLAGRANVKVPGQPEAALIPQIVEWIQGHPLALILLVPLAAKRGLQRLWQDLQKQPLKGIEAAFAVSFERLTREQQRLFTRLSVFTIAFAWEAAEALLPDENNADELLDLLVQRALVSFDGARYNYHALLRQFAYTRLGAAEDVRTSHRLGAAYLQTKSPKTPEEGLEEVDQWEKAEEWETFVKQASDLVGSLDRLGYWPEIDERLLRAEQSLSQLTTRVNHQGDLLNAHATIAHKSARWEEAIVLWKQALQAFQHVGDLYSIAQTCNNLGIAYRSKGEWDHAIELHEQALQAFQQVGDIHSIAPILGNLGIAYRSKGEWDRAIELYEQALQAFQQVSDLSGIAQTCNNLGIVYWNKGEWDRAMEFYEQALQAFQQVDDIHSIAHTYNNLGIVCWSKGEWAHGIELHEQALQAFQQVGDLHGMAQTYNNLGNVYGSKGEWDRAMELYEQALQAFQQMGDVHSMATSLGNLSLFYQARNEPAQAVLYMANAYRIFTHLGASEAQQAGQTLVDILGSVEAAQAYLEQMSQGDE